MDFTVDTVKGALDAATAMKEGPINLLGRWTIPGAVECSGELFQDERDALESIGNGEALFRIIQHGMDLTLDRYDEILMDWEFLADGSVSEDDAMLEYTYRDERDVGHDIVSASVSWKGEIQSNNSVVLSEQLMMNIKGDNVSVTCSMMLERLDDSS